MTDALINPIDVCTIFREEKKGSFLLLTGCRFSLLSKPVLFALNNVYICSCITVGEKKNTTSMESIAQFLE